NKGIRARMEGEPIETPPYPQPIADPSSAVHATGPGIRNSGAEQPLMPLFEGWERESLAAGITGKTVKEDKSVLTRFLSFLGHEHANGIAPHEGVAWKDKRIADGLPPKTVKDVALSAMKSVFGWAFNNHKLPANPAKGVTVKVGKKVRGRGPGFT